MPHVPPASDSSHPRPATRASRRGRAAVATTAVLALVSGTLGVGLLIAPPASSTEPAPAAAPAPDDLLKPAAEVQAAPTPAAPAVLDADAPDAPAPSAPETAPPAGGLPRIAEPDPEETVTTIVQVADTAWWGVDRAKRAIERDVRSAAADAAHTNAEVSFVREYRHAFSGLAVRAPRWALDTIRAAANIDAAFEETTYRIPAPPEVAALATTDDLVANWTSLAMTGADQVGALGDGMLVSIIDTGVQVDHEAFSGPIDTATARLDAAGLDALRGELGQGSGARFVGAKIPFAYDYADDDDNVVPATGGDMTHGTHVAGIAAADAGRIRGTAPRAQIMVQKVFDDLNGGAKDSAILAALDDAAVLRPDVVNLSLGADAGYSVDRTGVYGRIYQTLRDRGVIVNAAAGNSVDSAVANMSGRGLSFASDPDRGIVADPSSYVPNLSVASIDNAEVRPYLRASDGRHIYFAPAQPSVEGAGGVAPFSDLPAGTHRYASAGVGSHDDMGALAAELARTGEDVSQLVVLVRRGGTQSGAPITFQDAVDAATYAFDGAVPAALLVLDNVDAARLTIPALTGSRFPVALVSRADGDALLASAEPTLTVASDQIDAPGDQYRASWFSSLGVTPDLQLKPDVAAPGGNIYSAVLGGGYDWLSGTSMATPQTTGILAAVKQHLVTEGIGGQRLSGQDAATRAMQLVMNTAVPVIDADTPGVPYSPRKQGAGIANVPAALTTPVWITVDDAPEVARPSASLGESVEGRFAFRFTAHNGSDADRAYTIDVSALSDRIADGLFQNHSTDYAGRGIDVSLAGDTVAGDVVTIPAGGTATVEVSLRAGDAFAQAVAEAVNGTFVEGFVTLRAPDVPRLTIPYLGFYGDWSAAPVFDADRTGGQPHLYGNTLVNAATGAPLGVNPLDADRASLALVDPSVVDPSRAVVSPTRYDVSNVRVQTLTGMLRSADQLAYRLVRDADGSVVRSYDYAQTRKSSYNSRAGAVLYGEAFLNPAPVFGAFGPDGAELQAGRYTIEQTATTAGPTATEHRHETSFTYDNTAAIVEKAEIVGTGDDQALSIAVSDDTWIAAFDLQEYAGAGYFSRTLGADPVRTENGRHVFEATIPLRDVRAAWDFSESRLGTARALPDTAVLYVWDYGLNASRPLPVTLQESPLTGVRIVQSEVALAPGQTLRLDAEVQPSNAVSADLAWSSSDPGVLAVDADGTARGVTAGTATITVSATPRAGGDPVSASLTVTVADVPEEVGLTVSPATLAVSERTQASLQALRAPSLRDQPVAWTSDDERIASVDGEGTVTGVTVGRTRVTATAVRPGGGEVSASAEVEVRQEDDADFVVRDGVLQGYTGTRSIISVPDGVREIAAGAFAQTGFTQITLPASLERIGDDAFREMPLLERVRIEDDPAAGRASRMTWIGDNAFTRSMRLTQINLPDSIAHLGAAVFSTTSLAEVDLPAALTVVPDRAFSGATRLARVGFGDGVTEIGPYAFGQALVLEQVALPSGLRTIGEGAFISTRLRELTLPAATETIGAGAFSGAPLRSLDLGAVREIATQAFTGTELTSLVLPDTLRVVGPAAFAHNRALETVTIGRHIEADALIGVFSTNADGAANPALREFLVPDDADAYRARDGLLYDKAGETLIAYPAARLTEGALTVPDGTRHLARFAAYGVPATTLHLPEGLETIGADALQQTRIAGFVAPDSLREIGRGAFSGSGSLATVALSHVTSLGAFAFADAPRLADVDLGDALLGIGAYAFQANTSLTSFVMPDSVTEVGESALLNSTALLRVHFGAGVASIGENALTGLPRLRELTVAEGSATYFTDENVLYGREADGIHLKLYLPTKTEAAYTVAPGTAVLDAQVFRGNAGLERVVLPEGLRDIRTGAFNSLPNLREVVLPDSLQTVDGFYFDPKLRTLEFGTQMRTFEPMWSMGTTIEHLVVRGGVDGSFTDGFVVDGAPRTAYFGPGMTSIDYTIGIPSVVVVPGDVRKLSFTGWARPSDLVVYVPDGTPGADVARQAVAESGLDPAAHVRPYTPLSVSLAVTPGGEGAVEATAAGAGGVLEVSGETRAYEYRFTQVSADGSRTVVREWEATPTVSTPLAAGAALSVEVRDATLLRAEGVWVDPAAAPVVVTDPTDLSVTAGADARFAAAATGAAPLTVQWQSRLGDGEWTDIAGAVDGALDLPAVTASADGTQYRAVFTNVAGQATSKAATLSVTAPGTDPGTETGTDPGTWPAPAAPQLTDDNRGDLQWTVDGSTYRVVLGARAAGAWVGVTLHSDPQFLGWQQADANGVVVVTLPAGTTGEHRLSFQLRDGSLLGWIPVFAGDGGTTAPDGGSTPGDGTGPGTGTGAGPGSDAQAGAAVGGSAGALVDTGGSPATAAGAALLALAALCAGGTVLLAVRGRRNPA